MGEIMKIDYADIVKEMVDAETSKSYTTIKHKEKWYSVEIKVNHLHFKDVDIYEEKI
jgi:hypothetical protein